jgi:hypothetical protein
MDNVTTATPIGGVTLEQYAQIAKAIATQRLDEHGAARYAQSRGISPSDWGWAARGWNARMDRDTDLAARFGRLFEEA